MQYHTITRRLDESPDSYYLAAVPELDVEAYGATAEEAMTNLDLVLDSVIEEWTRQGVEIPRPSLLASAPAGTSIAFDWGVDSDRKSHSVVHMVSGDRAPVAFAGAFCLA